MTKNILTEQARHPLHKVIRELKWGRPAASQKFLLSLAAELKSKKPRPVCMNCAEPLVPVAVEMQDKTIFRAWTCDCAPNAGGQARESYERCPAPTG